MALTCLRWVIVVAILLPLKRRDLVAAWPVLAAHWRSVLAMGTLGFTAFNALFYVAAHHTSAVNLTIIQGSIPVIVLIGSALFFATTIRLLQILGMAVTMAGVLLVASRGDLEALLGLAFNVGDLMMIFACTFYAGYTLGLRTRPAVPGFVYFTALAVVAFVTTIPLLVYEIATGTVQWPTPAGFGILLYVGIFPSLLSQLLFMRGVELIGPARAGLFVNLVPVFGALLAVMILGEPFRWYHAAALVLVLGGIWLSERGRVA